jgi:hypothetical protein
MFEIRQGCFMCIENVAYSPISCTIMLYVWVREVEARFMQPTLGNLCKLEVRIKLRSLYYCRNSLQCTENFQSISCNVINWATWFTRINNAFLWKEMLYVFWDVKVMKETRGKPWQVVKLPARSRRKRFVQKAILLTKKSMNWQLIYNRPADIQASNIFI